MKRSLVALSLFAACTTTPPPKVSPPPRSLNGLIPVTSVTKTIVEPRIRVGMLSDQTAATFPRVEGGYILITDSGSSLLRRGFTDAAPLSETSLHYAVQASAISDKPSAEAFTEKVRTDTGQRVDAIFDPAGGVYRIIAGDFLDTRAAQPLRDQLVARGYGKDMLIVRRPTDQPFERRHQIVDDEGQPYTMTG